MKNIKLALVATCSCPNQPLLTPGQECENCMGVVGEPDEACSPNKGVGSFTQDYFEKFDEYLEQSEAA